MILNCIVNLQSLKQYGIGIKTKAYDNGTEMRTQK